MISNTAITTKSKATPPLAAAAMTVVVATCGRGGGGGGDGEDGGGGEEDGAPLVSVRVFTYEVRIEIYQNVESIQRTMVMKMFVHTYSVCLHAAYCIYSNLK